jgi:hypothetical protein
VLTLAAFALLVAIPVRRPALRGALLVGLVALELLLFGHGYNPVLPKRSFYPSNPLARHWQRDESLHRTTALGATLLPDTHLFEHISDVRGMDYPTRWFSDYMDLTGDRSDWDVSYGVLLSGIASPLTRVLNLKYVLVPQQPRSVDTMGLHWIGHSRGVSLGELAAPQPRSFLVHEAVRARGDEDAARLLREDPSRVFHRVVLSDASPVAATDVEPLPETGVESSVQPLAYEADRSSWRVDAARAGYVVTTDTYYPGWNAYLDDDRVAVYRANLAFRAVYVPAGTHLLEYRYEPRSFRCGVLLAACALGTVIAMASLAIRDR